MQFIISFAASRREPWSISRMAFMCSLSDRGAKASYRDATVAARLAKPCRPAGARRRRQDLPEAVSHPASPHFASRALLSFPTTTPRTGERTNEIPQVRPNRMAGERGRLWDVGNGRLDGLRGHRVARGTAAIRRSRLQLLRYRLGVR